MTCTGVYGTATPASNVLYTAAVSTRPIATSTLWQLISQIVMAALSIASTKLVALSLNQELFGLYNTAYGYLQVFGILADFGLYAVAVREISRAAPGPARSAMLGHLFVLRAIILGLSLGSALLIAWLVPHWQGTPLPLGITIAAFVPGFTLLAGVLRTSFQVHYRMQWVFVAEVSQRILAVGIIAALAAYVWNGGDAERAYFGMLAAGGIGAALLFVVSALANQRLIPLQIHWNPVILRSLFRQISPYGLAFLCMALYRQLDVTFIGLLRVDHAVQNSYYGAVQRMMDMAYLLPTFLLNSALPIITQKQQRQEPTADLMGSLLLACLIIGGISCLFGLFWAAPLVRLLTSETYLATAGSAGSDTALHLLALPMLCNAIIVLAFYMLLATHQWPALVRTLSAGVAVSLLSNLALIPRLGFVGAGVTSLFVHGLLACLLLPQAYWAIPWRVRREQWIAVGWFLGGLALFLLVVRPFLNTDLATVIGLTLSGAWLVGTGYWLGLHRTLRGA